MPNWRRSTRRLRRLRSEGDFFSAPGDCGPTAAFPAASSRLSRRHWLQHAALGALAIPGWNFLNRVETHAAEIRKRQKACILLWMSGGPPTIDMWDLKPGSPNGGEFTPISSTGDLQICEHLPQTAKVMKHLSVIRSMSTRGHLGGVSEATLALIEGRDPGEAVRAFGARERAFGRVTCPLLERAA